MIKRRISVYCFQSSFRRELVITCPAFWYWLVPASQVSEEVGCRHRMSLPSREPGQGRFLYPEAVLPADTEKKKQPHRRPQTSRDRGTLTFLHFTGQQVRTHSCYLAMKRMMTTCLFVQVELINFRQNPTYTSISSTNKNPEIVKLLE